VSLGRQESISILAPLAPFYLLRNDIERRRRELDRAVPWWPDLSDARQQVLVSMYFNLGISGLLAFKQMLAACKRGD